MNDFVKFGLIILAVMFIMKYLKGEVEGMEALTENKKVDVTEAEAEANDDTGIEAELDEVDEVDEANQVEPSDNLADVGAEVGAEVQSNEAEQLTANDLLPADSEADEWAEENPEGDGMVADKNFLTAGHHIGIDSVGQTLKNANYGLRSEPSIPREDVGPWLNSTIEADTNRRPLEISS
jgi:hypothetical protein